MEKMKRNKNKKYLQQYSKNKQANYYHWTNNFEQKDKPRGNT